MAHRRAIEGSEFEVVVAAMERPLGSFIAQMMLSRSLAEEVLQETFLVAWRERARMPDNESERRAWIYGVARNQTLHALRKGRQRKRVFDRVAAQRLDEAGPQHGESIAMRDLLLRTLKPHDRSLFVLRYVHGFSAESLAEMTGLKPAAVRKRLERSSTALRRAITRELDDRHPQEGPHDQAFSSI